MRDLLNNKEFSPIKWQSILLITVVSLLAYMTFEWLFLITKPSFMSTMSFFGQITVLFSSVSLLVILYLLFWGLAQLLTRIKHKTVRSLLVLLSLAIPAFITAGLLLLLIDNFSYTIFQFGIVTSKGVFRAVYALTFLVLFLISFAEISKLYQRSEIFLKKLNKRSKQIIFSICILFLFFVGVIPIVLNFQHQYIDNKSISKIDKPNIFLFTADGLNAENMSVYGYGRETTPFIEELAGESLVSLNAFTNSGNTSGSIVSIFTSKYPIDTHLLYPPDILKGEDAYQHLPAILKINGYYNAQFSFGHYVDAYEQNIRNGFDEANGRSYQSNLLNQFTRWLPTDMGYFIYETFNRIFDRLRHIFFIKEMSNPSTEVSSPDNYNDSIKIDYVLNLIDSIDKPLFTHVHWMGTHGARFSPENQVFSEGKDPEYQEDWNLDFYDDSILDFDQAINIFYHELAARNLLDNSVIIIASDHGQGFVTNKRLPLIFRFPNSENTQKITENAQNLDIAPTILDYLGIAKPEWMQGSSLLHEIPTDRPIFSVGVGNVEFEDGSVVVQSVKPPFYQFGFAAVVVCDTWYKLDLSNYSWETEKISNYTGQCIHPQLTKKESISLLNNFFETYHYDTSSIEQLFE